MVFDKDGDNKKKGSDEKTRSKKKSGCDMVSPPTGDLNEKYDYKHK